MPSADFCHFISLPFDIDSFKAKCQISLGNARIYFLSYACCIYAQTFRKKYRALKIVAFLPSLTASMQFLFVKPEFCFQLPSDFTSR
jgi:hypothetical protein